MTRDLHGKDLAWYRFTETPGKIYGPRDMRFVYGQYGLRETCEVAKAGPDGQPMEPWFPAKHLRARLKSEAVQTKQLKRLRELGVAFDEQTIDRLDAVDLLYTAELRQPPTADEIEEAQAFGVRVTPGMTRAELSRLLSPALEAEEQAEEERERIENNAEWVTILRKKGVTVADDVGDAKLQRLMELADEQEFVEEEAREMNIHVSRAAKGRSAEQIASSTDAVRRCMELAEELNQDFLVELFSLKRPPSKKLMKSLYAGLQEQLAARPDFGGKDAKVWFLTEAAKALNIALTIEDRTGKAPAPTTATETASPWVGLRWALVGIVVFALIRLCAG